MSSSGVSSPTEYTALEVDQAPKRPGIYAWYIRTDLSDFDSQDAVEGGIDLAEERFLTSLARLADCFSPESVRLTGRGAYGSRWQGQLESPSLRAEIDQTTESAPAANRLRFVAGDARRRSALIHLLQRSVPAFAAPVYVGVTARSLRARLNEHKNDYDDAMKLLGAEPGIARTLRDEGSSFGQRLAGAGVALDQLVVFVLPVELDDVPHKQREDAANAIESYLHRLFQPTFGRR